MSIRMDLEERLENEDNLLIKYVIEDILQQDNDYIESYIEDVLKHGCVSGMVSSLIYYGDTHAFYDKYYDEIEDLRVEYLDEGFDLLANIGDKDLKNHLAWFGYEESLRKVADELEVYA
jgi:hypothetical protein